MKDMEWELLGEVCVDSGQLMITDPCYIGDDGNDGTLTFDSGYGDGVYPVFYQKNEHGRIMTVLIDMAMFPSQEEEE